MATRRLHASAGGDHSFAGKRIAIATIFDRLDHGFCANCALRVFEECRSLPLPVIAGTPTSAP
ncbi:MAG: hypothetical protein KGJ30_02325 [Burkholderiales bacterium]|nr:hypothetical protein [Burkholderiales bacterium]MDE2157732.1 hypothetical protein [Burkholderiales bacterium]